MRLIVQIDKSIGIFQGKHKYNRERLCLGDCKSVNIEDTIGNGNIPIILRIILMKKIKTTLLIEIITVELKGP